MPSWCRTVPHIFNSYLPKTRCADLTSKRIALLKEIVPSARRIAPFMHPDEPINTLQIQDVEGRRPHLTLNTRRFRCGPSRICNKDFSKQSNGRLMLSVRLVGQGFTLGAETGRLASKSNFLLCFYSVGTLKRVADGIFC